jgi:hypothetical protein
MTAGWHRWRPLQKASFLKKGGKKVERTEREALTWYSDLRGKEPA